MATARELAASAGLRANRRISGQPVVYSRGASTLSVEGAVKKSNGIEPLEQDVKNDLVRAVVWRIGVANLGAMGEPQIGDRITDASGVIHRVESPDDGEWHWRHTDTGQTEFTVFTRVLDEDFDNQPRMRSLQGSEVRPWTL